MPNQLRRTALGVPRYSSVAEIVNARLNLGEKTLSYEFFPPKNDADADDLLWKTFDELVDAGLDFVSVTYGAGGSNREKSFEVLGKMAARVLTVGHLTAVGASKSESKRIIEEFRKLGVNSILALRGDPPRDNPDALREGEIKRAIELVELAEELGDVEVGVAAFPEGHPESTDLAQDVAVLRLKQDAGASFAITQLFFGVEHYSRLLEDSARAGVTMPIIPGVMPIANAKQVIRMASLSGAKLPTDLLSQLETNEPDEAKLIGMEYTADLAAKLLAAGAPGLHIYSLNHSKAALEIASSVGLVS